MNTRAIIVAIAMAAVACGDRVCTLAGCAAGLNVHFTTAPTVPFKVEVVSLTSPGAATYTFDCPDPVRCGQAAWFPDFTPDWVTVRIITATTTKEYTQLRPEWQTSYPNGPTCGPTCKSAVIVVTFPSATGVR